MCVHVCVSVVSCVWGHLLPVGPTQGLGLFGASVCVGVGRGFGELFWC